MINLLPPEYRESIDYGRKNTRILSWVTTLIFGIIVLFLVSIFGRLTFNIATNQANSQKDSINSEITSSNLNSVEQQYSDFLDGLTGLKKIYQQQILYSRLIKKLATLIPPDSKLSSIALTDSDRAITLNFVNSRDNLGPTIQVNLENQGEYIAQQTRVLLPGAFSVDLAGKLVTQSDGSQIPQIIINSDSRELRFFVNIENDKAYDTLSNALKNGGEFAYSLLAPSFDSSGYTSQESPSNVPHLDSYTVNTQNKTVDFYFSANSMDEMNAVKNVIDSNKWGAFTETYLFNDTGYIFGKDCIAQISGSNKSTCDAVCSNGLDNCDYDQKVCIPKSEKGCHYVIRGYYDELYTNAKITSVSSAEQATCNSNGNSCTHKIVATYNQLFEKIDINRVTACQADAISGLNQCKVEMRAQFDPNSKFYLISDGGATK